MRTKLLLLVLTFTFISVYNVQAFKVDEIDGYYWQSLTEEKKADTTVGVIMASYAWSEVMYDMIENPDEDTLMVYARMMPMSEYIWTDIVSKVNDWYRRNDLEAPLWMVMFLVADQRPDYNTSSPYGGT